MAKRARVWYAHGNVTTDESVVIENMDDYNKYIADGNFFFHRSAYVKEILDEGKKIVINSVGGWCWEQEGVIEIREILEG